MRNKRNETSVFIHVLIQYKITTTHWSGAVQFYFMIWGRKLSYFDKSNLTHASIIQKRPPWPTNNYESNQVLPPVSYYFISKSCYLLITQSGNFPKFKFWNFPLRVTKTTMSHPNYACPSFLTKYYLNKPEMNFRANVRHKFEIWKTSGKMQ